MFGLNAWWRTFIFSLKKVGPQTEQRDTCCCGNHWMKNLNREKEERDQLYKEDIKRSPRCREWLTTTAGVIGRHLQGCWSPHKQPHLLAACSGATSSQGKLKGLHVLGGSRCNSLRRVGRHCGLHGCQRLPFRMLLRGAFDTTLAWSLKAEACFNQFQLR